MKGTRPLDNDEIRQVFACFTGNPYEVRNRGLFMLGVSTGGRIGDLRSQLEQATDRENALITEKSIILDMLSTEQKKAVC